MAEVMTGEVTSVRAGLERILDEYDRARRHDEFGSSHPLWQVFTSVARLLESQGPLLSYPLVRVKWSVGQGKWTNVPHVSFLDSRETTTTKEGVYPVLLFRQDGTALYFAVAQGISNLKEELGTTAALEEIRSRAAVLQSRFTSLLDAGFVAGREIELRSDDPRLGPWYEASTIAFKQYDAGAVPSDDELRADLAAVLSPYDIYAREEHSAALVTRVEEWKEQDGYPVDDADERTAQRQQVAAALTEANLDSVIEDPSRFDVLEFGQFAHKAYGDPGNMSVIHTELAENAEAKRRLARALKHLLYDDADEAGRIDDVMQQDEWRVKGFKEALVTKALAVIYPDRWLPLFKFEGEMGKRRIMQSPELGIALPRVEDLTPGEVIRWSNDAIRHVLEPVVPGDPWGQMHFAYWLRDKSEPTSPPTPSDALDSVATELFVPVAWLREVFTLLREKKQIIFQGPPGTGKTYVARRLARHFADLGGGMEIVQFHPSYSYEDFVEGYRPALVAGQPGFKLVEGPLRRLARQAEADKDHVFVLVIDELNRGNVAKVFGELYYLLEYRNDRIRLQYGSEDDDEDDAAHFSLPDNLWIIATMNTADRSIALMDAALRRRFYFVDYYPTEWPIDELLENWLRTNERWPDLKWLVEVLEEANKRLDDRESSVGPSHFLLGDAGDLTDERIDRIWKYAVLPYLTERLVGETDRIKREFTLAKLRAAASSDTAPVEAEDEAVASTPSFGDGDTRA